MSTSQTYTKPPMSYGEQEFRTLTDEDILKIGHEIGEQFGHSSLHCIAYYGLHDALRVIRIAHDINLAVMRMREKS